MRSFHSNKVLFCSIAKISGLKGHSGALAILAVFEILLRLVRRMAAQGRLAFRAIVVIVDVDEL